jgi:predicted HNH restriction endonuclease
METQTPKTIIVRQLRQLWLRSRERGEALKRDKYSCVRCGIKKSVKKGSEQKIEVHHKEGVCNWDKIIEVIREELLCSIDKLESLCPDCHDRL